MKEIQEEKGEAHMMRKSPRSNSSDQPSTSARRPAGGGAECSGARRCSVRAVPDLPGRREPERRAQARLPVNLAQPWVVSNGQIITPAGTQVYLGITTRAKAVALNPNTGNAYRRRPSNGRPAGCHDFQHPDRRCPADLQTVRHGLSDSGSNTGITYTPDGLHLLFSQDGVAAYVAIASVDPTTGLLSDFAHVSVPMDVDADGVLTTVTCFPNSPPGTTGSAEIPCGQTVSIVSDGTPTSYPMGIAISSDGKTAYAVLDNNDTLTKIDLTAATPKQGAEIRVGNVPHSVVISPDGNTAYVSNEAGRIATAKDFQGYSNGTPVVAEYPTGSTSTGTVSVVDLASFTVTGSISTGLHPTGMAFWGKYLLVANAYSDSISVIDTTTNTGGEARSTSGCRSAYPANAIRPTAPGRTRSPSMP